MSCFTKIRMKPITIIHCVFTLLALAACRARAAEQTQDKLWVDPDRALHDDPDFAIQGEYRNADGEAAMGAQVVALGNGRFDVHVLDGGLPGAGWEPGKSRTTMKGELKDGKVGVLDGAGNCAGNLAKGLFALSTADGKKHQLSRIDRHSPTLGAAPATGAMVLFDGSSAAQWANGEVENGLLAAGCTTIQRFGNYHLHLEFRTPYQPMDRGQKRGNSGVYHSGRWETQVLDSFGLEPEDNDCGGIYSISKPRLNMCLPPLTWQTYDVDFAAAKFDAEGKRTAWARITVRLNGVLVHEDLELNKDFTTSAPITTPLANPEGPVFLQDHQNPVVFRNIWITSPSSGPPVRPPAIKGGSDGDSLPSSSPESRDGGNPNSRLKALLKWNGSQNPSSAATSDTVRVAGRKRS